MNNSAPSCISKYRFIPHKSRLQALGAFLLLMGVLFTPTFTYGQNNALAQELLARMSQSLRQINYRGKFTYEVADNAIENYELSHWIGEDGEQEHLIRLNGPEKMVVRNSAQVNCLAVGDQILRGQIGNIHPSDQLFSNYSLYLRGEHRIANRPAYLLQLVPHDLFRNGQTIAVDKETFLPLQQQWFSPDNKLIERLQFIDIEIDPPLDSLPAAQTNSATLNFDESACDTNEEEPGFVAWGVDWLPKGFLLTRVSRTSEGELMLSYTDGLASFSIFVGEKPVTMMIQGKSSRGATIAYVGNQTMAQQAYRITVIGEIPVITAQKVAASMTPVSRPR